MLLSARAGLQDDDRTSQEQYAFFLNRGTIAATPRFTTTRRTSSGASHSSPAST